MPNQKTPRPQSIVHQLSRMGSKMAKPIKQRVASRRRRTLQECKHGEDETLQESKRTVETPTQQEEYDSQDEWSITSESKCSALHEEDEGEGDFFVTLNQNELLIECFMANECSDVTFIVLFCAEECSLSEQLEDAVLARTVEYRSKCQCRRVASRTAPMLTKKLQIEAEKPTIVAVKNGCVVGRISDLSSSQCWEQVEQWLADSKILTRKDSESDFQCVSTEP